mgnify:CR=1 FL=1
MSTLTGRQISDTYKQLIKLAVSANAGVSADLTQIQTGDGTNIAFQYLLKVLMLQHLMQKCVPLHSTVMVPILQVLIPV